MDIFFDVTKLFRRTRRDVEAASAGLAAIIGKNRQNGLTAMSPPPAGRVLEPCWLDFRAVFELLQHRQEIYPLTAQRSARHE